MFKLNPDEIIMLTGVANGVNRFPIKIDTVVPMMKGFALNFNILAVRKMIGLIMRATDTSSMIPLTKALTIQNK